MRLRTRRAVSGLLVQIASSAFITSAVSTAWTGASPKTRASHLAPSGDSATRLDIIAGASLALRTVNPALSVVKIRLGLPRRRTRDVANYGNLDVSTWIPER